MMLIATVPTTQPIIIAMPKVNHESSSAPESTKLKYVIKVRPIPIKKIQTRSTEIPMSDMRSPTRNGSILMKNGSMPCIYGVTYGNKKLPRSRPITNQTMANAMRFNR